MRKIIFIYFIAAIISGAGFYFAYPPRVVNNTIADSSIIIKFDKPIKRQEISHVITPDILGEWSFKDSLIKNHLFKTLVFNPAVDFKPNTEYRIDLENIVNTFGIGMTGNFSFTFKTSPMKEVRLPSFKKSRGAQNNTD